MKPIAVTQPLAEYNALKAVILAVVEAPILISLFFYLLYTYAKYDFLLANFMR
jgi:hypothetical protein